MGNRKQFPPDPRVLSSVHRERERRTFVVHPQLQRNGGAIGARGCDRAPRQVLIAGHGIVQAIERDRYY